jgi:hypothetical protein
VCDSAFDAGCFVLNGCWGKLGGFVGIIGGIGVALAILGLAAKTGLLTTALSPMMRCLRLGRGGGDTGMAAGMAKVTPWGSTTQTQGKPSRVSRSRRASKQRSRGPSTARYTRPGKAYYYQPVPAASGSPPPAPPMLASYDSGLWTTPQAYPPPAAYALESFRGSAGGGCGHRSLGLRRGNEGTVLGAGHRMGRSGGQIAAYGSYGDLGDDADSGDYGGDYGVLLAHSPGGARLPPPTSRPPLLPWPGRSSQPAGFEQGNPLHAPR